MRKSVLLVASFSTMAMLLTGCQSSLTGDSYSRDEARRVQTVRMGTIESLRPVKIEGTKTPIGGLPVQLSAALAAAPSVAARAASSPQSSAQSPAAWWVRQPKKA
jgi:outer membrane lipoprotein SlyB